MLRTSTYRSLDRTPWVPALRVNCRVCVRTFSASGIYSHVGNEVQQQVGEDARMTTVGNLDLILGVSEYHFNRRHHHLQSPD